jgi:UDP-N-acetylmuramoyl-L-alanyl-D-glutamate--2,6-diaminopimelate ligase
MNNYIKKIPAEYIEKISISTSTEIDISNITHMAECSDQNTILFYNITDLNKFYERMKSTSYGVLLVNKKIENLENVLVIKDEFWLETQKILLDQLYPFDFEKIDFVGITGTNGKTTTVHLLASIAKMNNINFISLGTLGVSTNQGIQDQFSLTSPSYIDFRKYLYHYGRNAKLCFMEVSSHSLVQSRYYKVKFSQIAWTSFSQDHLDYHKDMQSYFNAKLRLTKLCKNPIIVPRSNETQNLRELLADNKINYNIAHEVKEILPTCFDVFFNKDNLELALEIFSKIKKDYFVKWDSLGMPEGRYLTCSYKDSTIIIDYAHTPEALKNIIGAINKTYPTKKLITLFGCGGNRDKSKRSLMGIVACENSDQVVLTSDNPRFEEPMDIIQNIISGLDNFKNYRVEPDRKAAITQTFKNLSNNILLIAGKGHEDYLEVKGVKHPYSDIHLVQELINR